LSGVPSIQSYLSASPSLPPLHISVNSSSQSIKSKAASSDGSKITILAVGVCVPIILLLLPFILWKLWSMQQVKQYACVPSSCSPEELSKANCTFSSLFDVCGMSQTVGGGMDLSVAGDVGNKDFLGPSSHGNLNVNVILSETVRV